VLDARYGVDMLDSSLASLGGEVYVALKGHVNLT
jgi:hypothetical protein